MRAHTLTCHRGVHGDDVEEYTAKHIVCVACDSTLRVWWADASVEAVHNLPVGAVVCLSRWRGDASHSRDNQRPSEPPRCMAGGACGG